MNLFKRKTQQKNVKETDNLTMKKNSNKNLSIILGLIFIAVSVFIIYKSMNINQRVILPKYALKFSSPAINFSPSVKMQHPKSFSNNTDKRLLPVHSNKFAKPDNFNKKIHLKPHLTPQAHTTGNYSSIIYKLDKQIEIAKLKHELALTKEGKNIQKMSNAQTMPNNLGIGILRMLPQYINPKGSKINNISKYFKNYKQNNTIRLKGVSNAAADVGIGKSNFVVQTGSEFDGYKVLNIGDSSITIVKDGKIKKLYIS